MTSTLEIFDFNTSSDLRNWHIVDDVVMGGGSNGQFRLNSDGHGEFSGRISLDNNGGFSSVQYRFSKIKSADYTMIRIRIKGDGKRYQLRVKSKSTEYFSYIAYFTTNGAWQTVDILFHEMYPSYRGKKLDMPNYPGETMEEIAFLIANKKAEDFKLEIDRIELR